ncbi:MAG: ElyC/SanA/YdcF family protein, partial [Pseudomonadota bacterium]
MLRWGLSLVLGGGLACLAAIFIGARAAPSCDALSAEDQTYDVAVVLGATIGGADGQSFGSSLTRADAGVHLIEIDVVERLHMTGGRLRPEWPSAGERMAEHAVSLGVAAEQISTEDQS